MQPDATLRGLTATIRRRNAAERLHVSARAFLEQAGVEGNDLEQMSSLGADRLLVYRRLVFNRFLDAVEMTIPRSMQRRGVDALVGDLSAFLDEDGSRSPYLRDIASEFVRWIAPIWAADDEIPAYLPDLARHELLSFEMASVRDDSEPVDPEDLDLERGVLFKKAARVVHYDFFVHELPLDEEDRSEPVRQPTSLLAYRDPDHRVRTLALGSVAAAVLTELLERKTTLREAIVRGCVEAGVPMDDEVLGGTAQLLSDLAERGVLLGPSAAT